MKLLPFLLFAVYSIMVMRFCYVLGLKTSRFDLERASVMLVKCNGILTGGTQNDKISNIP